MQYNVAKGKFFALIPARGGSKGVPRKNIKKLSGFPLIAYSIAAAKLSKRIERAIISTEDDEIATIAQKFGGEVPFMRPVEFAGDSSSDTEVIFHALKWLLENEGSIPEYLVHLRPTTPLREPALLDEAITKFEEIKDYTSLRSAHLAPESPYKWFKLNGFEFQSFIPNISNDDLNKDRHLFPDAYIPDGYVDILRSEYILEHNKLHGAKMMAYCSPFCIEVDTQNEFDLLEYELNKTSSQLYDYLKKEFN